MWSTYVTISLLALIGAGVSANKFKDCGSIAGSYTDVRVSGCEGKSTCVLKRNKNVSIEIDFTANGEFSDVTTVVHGIIMDIPMPFPMSNPNACIDSGLTCPVLPGEQQHYVSTLAVLKSYPKISVTVKWELRNEHDEDIVCVEIQAKIE